MYTSCHFSSRFFFSPPVTNPCDRKKCEWLCLLSPSGPVCTCPNNYMADNGTCVERPTPTQSPFCESAHCISAHTIMKSDAARGTLVSLWSPSPSAAPPSGPCDLQCLHGGSCFLNARQVAKCRCQPSYTGERCEINQCRDYCKNGGTCTASHTGESSTEPSERLTESFFKSILCINMNCLARKMTFSVQSDPILFIKRFLKRHS